MTSVSLGLMFELEYNKVPFLGLFYFLYMSMIYQMILKANLSYLLLTLCFTLFPVAHEVNTSASDINNDLKLVRDWAFLWKISFHGDHSKQAE